MTRSSTSYRTFANRAQTDAEESDLPRVRERNLRAAEAWRKMAERQERAALGRETANAPSEELQPDGTKS